uniref:WWamide-1 n=1 Tax=Lissachatina fulica TaxID=2315439 RepID=WWA1_LISFU|nr:RecName: Full=WWamide-1 [Lissachatina fulica]AAB26826.1 WWamide-2=neuromodulatory peptide [Achatina fulica=African giant snails, ganglia, Peptide, 7 aa] [Lissachatina fulica]
WREMSVW